MELALQGFVVLVDHDSTHVDFYLGEGEVAAEILEQVLQVLTLVLIDVHYELLQVDRLFRMQLHCEIVAVVFLEVFHVLLDHACILVRCCHAQTDALEVLQLSQIVCVLQNVLAADRQISHGSEYAAEMPNLIVFDHIGVVVEAINTLIGGGDVFENLGLIDALFIIVV